jgi:hypothetical protein
MPRKSTGPILTQLPVKSTATPILTNYNNARRALELARTVDDAAKIKDAAAALEAYAHQRKDVQMEAWLSEIKARAYMRIGELSAELPLAPPAAGPGRGKRGQAKQLPSGGKPFKKQALKAAGISTSVAHRAENLAKNRRAVETYIASKVAAAKPVKITEVLAAVEAVNREQKRKAELHKAVQVDLPEGLIAEDFRIASAGIPDNSVELIFTDPPYDRESIPLFEDAAKVAARILKPGGSFITYCGHIQLPETIILCGKHLRYWWTIACVHAGPDFARMQKYGIVVKWKPLMWFVKDNRGDTRTFVDDVVSGATEKSYHEWQQAENEAAYYIEKLTSDHGLVVDFFVGGGTTLAAAKKLGRRWIGYEINKITAAKAAKRLEEWKVA